ncbi:MULTISPECIES: hypothetical protein [unclassified Pseudomonas]|uniref:hypothetical protein n=1 Tax=unclassified Pseudomonas TaxID=196821 RepID=UPI000270ACD1|nr:MULTISPECIES: hypothetical protein [unclassified Pseudomonas]EJM83847.1 hypothetical protein PMI33_04106 [Pseudomonas sp. GM67]MBD9547417.1 hypothetical protein [Pseudomonas sp. PDM01]
MSEEKIRGRNLVKSGRFPSGWDTNWQRVGNGGGEGWYESILYGNFLMLNGKRVYSQSVSTASFTESQFSQVEYLLGFQYENKGDGPGSKVILMFSNGTEDPIDLSGKKKNLLDDESWNPYLRHTLTVLQSDQSVDLQIHGADITGARGLRTTDFDIQIELPPLELKSLTVDNVEYRRLD